MQDGDNGYLDLEVEAQIDAGETLSGDEADAAQRYMRAHRRYHWLMERNNELRDSEIARIEQHYTRGNEGLSRRIQFLEMALRVLAEHEMAASNGKRKKLSTPFGSVQLRKPSPRLVVDDEALVISRLDEMDDMQQFVIVNTSVDKAGLKKHMLSTGETFGGCRIETDEQHGMTIKHHWEADEGEEPDEERETPDAG